MVAFTILCVLVAILLLFYYYVTYDFDYWTSRGVNGPKPRAFFGNISEYMLGKKSLGDILKDIYDAYPNERVVGIFVKGDPVLMLRDEECIKHMMIKDFSLFAERPEPVFEKAELMSLHLFQLDAVRWRSLRTQLSPTFTSGKLKDMFQLMLNCADHFEDYLAEIAPKEAIIECRALTAKFTVDVIGSCAFGLEMNAMKEEDNEFCRIGYRIFRSDLKVLVRNILRDIPWLFKHIGHWIDDHDVNDFMVNITRETINYRKKNNVRRKDFIDTLIEFKDHPEKLENIDVTDVFLAAQAFVFFAAGFETSATTITHAMYELAFNQDIQERLRAEIKETLDAANGKIVFEDLKKMTYLEQVFRETLRKYPPLMFLARRALQDYTFESVQVTIQKGVRVFIPIFAIQRDPKYFPNPDVFDPERFSEDKVEMKNAMYYLPFGTGPRNCIGARFAAYQVKVGLIKVLKNYKIDVCEKTENPIVVHPMSILMLQPRDGIHLKLTKLT